MTRPVQSADVAVVGAGITGLALAYAHARRGDRVVLFERDAQSAGASVRNFGLVWPVGQPDGPLHQRALRTREVWLDLAARAGLWSAASGSLHLAYHPDELGLLEEFCDSSQRRAGRALLAREEVLQKAPAVNPKGLLGGLWSETELTVDPREALRKLPAWLERSLGVSLRFGSMVSGISLPDVETPRETWRVQRAYICTGRDFEALYPELHAASGLTRCRLQMLRTVPQPAGWRLGPALCGGLTLCFYSPFQQCSQVAAVRARFQRELPFFLDQGIHVLVASAPTGALTLGDSHQYGLNPAPFDREDIFLAILSYARGLVNAPSFEVAERWHGVYARLEGQTEWICAVEPGVLIVNGLTAGMTLAFGLAEELVQGL